MYLLVIIAALCGTWNAYATPFTAQSVAEATVEDDHDGLKLKPGAYLDSGVAYDFNRPSLFDEAYSTVPARHNELNLTLGYIDGTFTGPRMHGRLAFQAGTAVQALYRKEPQVGEVSGGTLVRHVQEAYAGYMPIDRLWIDAGIYFSHFGFESWIPRLNWSYSRSLLRELEPYYQSGIRISYDVIPQLSFQVHLLNGWQNASERDTAKSFATQMRAQPWRPIVFTWNNYAGKDKGMRRRVMEELILEAAVTEKLSLAGVYTLGFENQENLTDLWFWGGAALHGRYQWNHWLTTAARIEAFRDRNGIVSRPEPGQQGLEASGFAVNGDVQLTKRLLWRTEWRTLWAKTPLFPSKSGDRDDTHAVMMSLALWY